MRIDYIRGVLACLAASLAALAQAEPAWLTVAVASNFIATAETIALDFERESGFPVRLVSGSSGRLFAQIRNGAPFDVFLSADADRPGILESSGTAVASSRRTYAMGRLVLWSARPPPDGDSCLAWLRRDDGLRLAIANPRVAPYGMAAKQVMARLDVDEALASRIAVGENVTQALQFAASGNAKLAFIPAAMASRPVLPQGGCHVLVEASLHSPIEQQAVALNERAQTRHFLEYLHGPAARATILAHGYDLPR